MLDREHHSTADARTSSEQSDPIATVHSSDRRKRTLAELAAGDGERTFEDLADAVARREEPEKTAADRGDGRTDERVAIALYHNHLPKLEELGFVECEGDRGPVRLTRNGAECVAFLDAE